MFSLKANNFGTIAKRGTRHAETAAAWAPRALSVLRIITGLMIIQHGMGKIIGSPVVPAYANLKPLSLIGAAGFIELIGGAADPRPADATGGFHPLGRDGDRLFPSRPSAFIH